MSDSAKGKPLISNIAKGLSKIRQNMEAPDGVITKDKVKAISTTSEELLGLILKSKKAK
jgi:hypothetical protein